MPVLLRLKGYRFFFYSGESGVPPHVDVSKDRNVAKFWIESITVVRNSRFTPLELREIARIISDYRLDFLRRWNEHFDDT